MKIRAFIIMVLVTIVLFSTKIVSAQSLYSPTATITPDDFISYFRNVYQIEKTDIKIPTVLQLPVNTNNQSDYAVYENETNTLQPHVVTTLQESTPFKVGRAQISTDEAALHDDNALTSVDYPVDPDVNDNTIVVLTFSYASPIRTSSLQFKLDQNIQRPKYVTIESKAPNSGTKILVNRQAVYSDTINMPVTTAAEFIVTFEHNQPLRINEIEFTQVGAPMRQFLRFLARSGNSYKVYANPASHPPYISTPESGDLIGSQVQVVEVSSVLQQNQLFRPPDMDLDGVDDQTDNCVNTKNEDQLDVNKNGKGDACEDFDKDGILNSTDNCPDHPNKLQQDEDGDGVGDHCDGIESRLIEQLPFLPWVGLAVGFGVVILLFKSVVNKPVIESKDEAPTEDNG